MMKWWKKFFKTAGRIWWRWDVRFCAIPTGRSIQQQSMESPGMCRSLIRELITFDLVKQTEDIAGELDPTQQAEQSGWGAFCYSRQFDVCDDQRVVTARLDSFFVQITDCLLYTSDAADDLLCVDLGGRRI